jgi:hypothetical protein
LRRANWSLALPEPLEEIVASPSVNGVAEALADGRARGVR